MEMCPEAGTLMSPLCVTRLHHGVKSPTPGSCKLCEATERINQLLSMEMCVNRGGGVQAEHRGSRLDPERVNLFTVWQRYKSSQNTRGHPSSKFSIWMILLYTELQWLADIHPHFHQQQNVRLAIHAQIFLKQPSRHSQRKRQFTPFRQKKSPLPTAVLRIPQ